MYSSRLLQLVLVALAIICAAEVSAKHDDRDLEARQDQVGSVVSSIISGSEEGDTAAVTTTSEPTTTEEDTPTSTTSEETTTAPAEDMSSTTSVAEETTSEAAPESTSENNPPATTTTEDSGSAPTTSPEPTSTTTKNGGGSGSGNSESDSDGNSSSNGGKDDSSTTEEPVVSTHVETVTRTNSDGSKETLTTSTLTTSTPETQEDNSGSSDGGLSTNTRNIIIGVVVGVGGAILLGALGVVAWRIRARKRAAEEDNTLMEYTGGYTPVDKSEPPSSAAGTTRSSDGRSPFQSTLESYHQPTNVNASSNF